MVYDIYRRVYKLFEQKGVIIIPPKSKVSKEDVLRESVTIVRESGLDAVTAKLLAKRLGCSIQPVYWLFSTMGELRGAVLLQVVEIYQKYMKTEIEGVTKFNMIGINYITFAINEPEAFKILFMTKREDKVDALTQIPTYGMGDFIEEVVMEENGLDREYANKLHIEMWTFCHGIATLIATGFAVFEKGVIAMMLSDVCNALIVRFKQQMEDKND